MIRWKAVLTGLLMCAALLYGCAFSGSSGEQLLFLPEGDRLVPYVLLSGDYGGNRLLLRRETLPRQLAFGADDAAYYPESAIDAYLRETFPERFPQWLPLCQTQIEVCRKFPDNSRTEQISRSVFLLSATEVGIDMDIVTVEGAPLAYFRDRSRYETHADDGTATGWWLRSTYPPDRGLAWHIQANGTLGGRTVRQPSGIRPALCIDADAPLEWREDLGGYVLREP